jgi:hypothetical protein
VAPKSKWCCNIESFGKITAANFGDYWIGQDEAVKGLVMGVFDASEGFGVPYSSNPKSAPAPVTDDNSDVEYEYEWTEEPMGLAGAPGFAKIIAALEASTSVDQLDKRIEWALSPKQAMAFSDYSEYTSVITQKGDAVKVGLTKADFDEIPF